MDNNTCGVVDQLLVELAPFPAEVLANVFALFLEAGMNNDPNSALQACEVRQLSASDSGWARSAVRRTPTDLSSNDRFGRYSSGRRNLHQDEPADDEDRGNNPREG